MSQISPQKTSLPSFSEAKQSFAQRCSLWFYAFWKFSRPHTIIGTTFSVLGLYLVALATAGDEGVEIGKTLTGLAAFNLSSVWIILLTLFACFCGNIYIVGLNQLEDIEIDKVNKPQLPLASGEFARWEAWAIVGFSGLLAIILAAFQGPYLLAMVSLSLIIGTAYSLPPIRLKRFPFWASFCIFTVRGVIVNLGLFLHFNYQFQRSINIPLTVWALTLFVLVFTFAIALFKDIPDLEGDRRYNIATFTIRLGQQSVFSLCRWVLTICYLGLILSSLFISGINAPFLIITHLLVLGRFLISSFRVDLRDKEAVARFYQFIWKLFFLEYLLFPISCLLEM